MAKFERSQFKTSKTLADQEAELSDKINFHKGGTANFIEFKEDGEYIVRFCPTPNPDSFFMVPNMVHFLLIELDKYQDGEIVLEDGVPVREVRRGTVPNSRIHGNTEKDICDEYIAYAEKLASELYPADKKKKEEYLRHVYGYGQGKNYVGGIVGQLDYIAYGNTVKKNSAGQYVEDEFGKIRIKPSIRKQMQKLASSEEGEDGGIIVDPFSDPDDGFLVKIVRDSVAGKADPVNYYQVSWCTKNYVPLKWPLPDGFETRFEDLKLLDEMYVNKYTSKDFENALDGLIRFDREYGYGVFDQPEFQDICEEIAAYYPDEDDESPTETKQKVTPTKVTPTKVTKEEVERLEDDEVDQDEVEQLKSSVDTDDDLPFEVDETPDDTASPVHKVQATEEEEKAVETVTKSMSTADRLKAMREKIEK